MNKEIIRPVYSELQGFLKQVPHNDGSTYIPSYWTRFNEMVDEISLKSKEGYSRYRLMPIEHGSGFPSIALPELRARLGQLIGRLHAAFFSDEPAPFPGMPATAINVSQSQGQAQQQFQQMLFDFQDLLEDKIQSAKTEAEKGFLSTLKKSLRKISSYAELISELVKAAQASGVTIHDLGKIFP